MNHAQTHSWMSIGNFETRGAIFDTWYNDINIPGYTRKLMRCGCTLDGVRCLQSERNRCVTRSAFALYFGIVHTYQISTARRVVNVPNASLVIACHAIVHTRIHTQKKKPHDTRTHTHADIYSRLHHTIKNVDEGFICYNRTRVDLFIIACPARANNVQQIG